MEETEDALVVGFERSRRDIGLVQADGHAVAGEAQGQLVPVFRLQRQRGMRLWGLSQREGVIRLEFRSFILGIGQPVDLDAVGLEQERQTVNAGWTMVLPGS